MPTVAYFLGISVRMFFNDHEPPLEIEFSDGTIASTISRPWPRRLPQWPNR
jgi:hypothetical protein